MPLHSYKQELLYESETTKHGHRRTLVHRTFPGRRRRRLGTPLGSRVSVEAFLPAQPLALELTSEDNTFALMSGMRTSLTLFQDATINLMVQASIGRMLLGKIEETESYLDLA